jgi:hypothetical protein
MYISRHCHFNNHVSERGVKFDEYSNFFLHCFSLSRPLPSIPRSDVNIPDHRFAGDG